MEAAKPGQPAETTFSHVKEGDTGFKSDGLRDFFLYRDLGIAKATGGKVVATLVRANKPPEEGTGWHRHIADFHIVIMLNGWARFMYEDQLTLVEAGDCVHQRPGIVHYLFDYRLGNENPFRCLFEVSPSARRVLPRRDVGDIISIKNHTDAVRQTATLFTDQATAMLEGSDRPDVIVAALPFDLIMRVVNDVAETGEEEESDEDPIDFRDLLKARTLHLQKPTQLVWPTLWDDTARIPRKLKSTMRKVQDPATRAWNLL